MSQNCLFFKPLKISNTIPKKCQVIICIENNPKNVKLNLSPSQTKSTVTHNQVNSWCKWSANERKCFCLSENIVGTSSHFNNEMIGLKFFTF